MTAELIRFEKHRDFRRGQLYGQQPVPRAPSQDTRPSPVELQVARIAKLLTELEELTRDPDEVPSATLNQARLGLERARCVILPWMAPDETEGDPQPDVDDERLERMYRDLNRDA